MTPEQNVRIGRVKPNDISVDPVVQRSLNVQRAQRMADEYDPSAVGVITVSDRDGLRYVVDGQHRVEAAKLAGQGAASVDAKIYTGLTRVEEARLFIALNSARIPNAVARFKVRREALDPVPVAIGGILERYGWEVGNPGSSGKASAVKALEAVWALDPDQDRKVFETTVDLITDTWGHDPDAMSASILGGMSEFVNRYAGQLDLVALAKKLRGVYSSPVVLVAQGKSLKATRGGRVSTCIGEIIHSVYNAKRSSGRLDRW
jgi:hypothetical protein